MSCSICTGLAHLCTLGCSLELTLRRPDGHGTPHIIFSFAGHDSLLKKQCLGGWGGAHQLHMQAKAYAGCPA